MDSDGGRRVLGRVHKVPERLLEKIVAGNDEQILIGQILPHQDQIDVADRA